MKVGYYIGDVGLHNGGIAPYTQRVLAALSAHEFSPDVEVCIIGRAATAPGVYRFAYEQVPTGFRLITHTWLQNFIRRARESYHLLIGDGFHPHRFSPLRGLAAFVKDIGVDVLHVPYQVPPSFDLHVPIVVTMHDVQELHLPQFFTAEDRRDRAIGHLRSIRQASVIVVSFDHVKQDLIRYFGCADDEVVVIPLPIGQCSLPLPEVEQSRRYQQKYAEYGEFFLYPAQTWEHKNHLRLMDAFDLACRRLSRPVSLICTGRKNDFYARIEARRRQLASANRVLFTDVVEERELCWLYQNALGVVVPTLYEAGSFPLIEAMQLGAAIVCARTTSLPDTIGDERFLFDPCDVDQIANALYRLADDASFRAASVANGQRRIRELNKVQVGAHYESVWRQAARRPGAVECEIRRRCA